MLAQQSAGVKKDSLGARFQDDWFLKHDINVFSHAFPVAVAHRDIRDEVVVDRDHVRIDLFQNQAVALDCRDLP